MSTPDIREICTTTAPPQFFFYSPLPRVYTPHYVGQYKHITDSSPSGQIGQTLGRIHSTTCRHSRPIIALICGGYPDAIRDTRRKISAYPASRRAFLNTGTRIINWLSGAALHVILSICLQIFWHASLQCPSNTVTEVLSKTLNTQSFYTIAA